MSSFMLTPSETSSETPSADDFSLLEQRVLRTIELLRAERLARATAEGNATTLQQLLDEQSQQLAEAEAQLKALESERANVRSRVERMMKQLDEMG